MNKVGKVEAILNAWLEFIDLEDYSQATIDIEKDPVRLHGVKLVDNRVLIDQDIFSALQQDLNKGQKGQQDKVWVLSFPKFFTVA